MFDETSQVEPIELPWPELRKRILGEGILLKNGLIEVLSFALGLGGEYFCFLNAFLWTGERVEWKRAVSCAVEDLRSLRAGCKTMHGTTRLWYRLC